MEEDFGAEEHCVSLYLFFISYFQFHMVLIFFIDYYRCNIGAYMDFEIVHFVEFYVLIFFEFDIITNVEYMENNMLKNIIKE